MHDCFDSPGDGLCTLGVIIPLFPIFSLQSILSFIPFSIGDYLVWPIFIAILYCIGFFFEYGLKMKHSFKKYFLIIPIIIVISAMLLYMFVTLDIAIH
jgi:hypothetical protein